MRGAFSIVPAYAPAYLWYKIAAMKKVNLLFDLNKDKRDIDVTFSASEKDVQVMSLMSRIREPLMEKIQVFDASGSSLQIKQSDIISISTDNKRLVVVTESGTYEAHMPLREIEQGLHPAIFLRISRFEIINLDKVERFSFPIKGSLKIEMKNGMITWASRRYISEIKERFMENS